MPKAQQDVNQTFTFVKGLITEQPELNASSDSFTSGVNLLVHTDGSATRRLGADYELGWGFTVTPATLKTTAISTGIWANVAGISNFNLVVVQEATTLHFFDLALTAPSSQEVAAINFSGLVLDASVARASRCQFASVGGGLVVVNAGSDPLYLEYTDDGTGNPTIDAISLVLRVRDFQGISDGYRVDEQPADLSSAHHYNLRNQGWGGAKELVGVTDNTGNGNSVGGGGTFTSDPTISAPVSGD